MKYLLAMLVLLSSDIALGGRQELDNIHNLMLVISQTESGMRQVDSPSGDDVGYFQIHKGEIDRRKLDKKRLQTDLLCQYGVALLIMADKKRECKKKYPDTWFCCYNSSTPKPHKEYYKKLKRSAKHLGINLEEVTK